MLLHEKLLLMHGLLLLLDRLLLSLKLILPSLELCKCNSGLLSLVSLILPHPSSMASRAGSVYGVGGAKLELSASWSCHRGGI